jgi:hypothetical protein
MGYDLYVPRRIDHTFRRHFDHGMCPILSSHHQPGTRWLTQQQLGIAWFAGARFDLAFAEGFTKSDLPSTPAQDVPQVKHGEL